MALWSMLFLGNLNKLLLPRYFKFSRFYCFLHFWFIDIRLYIHAYNRFKVVFSKVQLEKWLSLQLVGWGNYLAYRRLLKMQHWFELLTNLWIPPFIFRVLQLYKWLNKVISNWVDRKNKRKNWKVDNEWFDHRYIQWT